MNFMLLNFLGEGGVGVGVWMGGGGGGVGGDDHAGSVLGAKIYQTKEIRV